MKQRLKGLASTLLTLAMVLGLMPGLGATALAETWEGNPYADFVGKTTTVTFNGKPWNVIADNSEAIDKGSLTLLAADTSFGVSQFDTNYSDNYDKPSTVKTYLRNIVAGTAGEGKPDFSNVASAIVDGELYLLSTDEISTLGLSSDVLKMNFTGGDCSYGEWWLRSPGTDGDGFEVAFVYGRLGYVYDNGDPVHWSYGVRPALQLNLESVIFESESKSFSVKPSHTHSFTSYTGGGATITATCANTDGNCTLDDGTEQHNHTVTLTLNANDAAYTGSAYAGASLDSTAWTAAGLTVPTIEYEGRGSTSYAKSATAPTNVGDYTASVTVEGEPATADFTISPMALTIDSATATDRDYDKDSTAVEISEVTFQNDDKQAVPLTLGDEGDYTATGAMADANAGQDKEVSVTVTLRNPNYSLATNTTTTKVNIAKAANPAKVAPTATVAKGGNSVDLSKNVTLNGATGDVNYAIDGEALGCSVNGTTGILTSGTTTGDVTVKVTVAEDDNHEALEAQTVTVTVSDKQVQTITAADVTATYGDTGAKVSATTDGDGTLSYEVTSGDAVAVDSTGKLTINKAGTATVTVTASETATYAEATKDVTVTVDKANAVAATVTANNRTYDGTEKPLVTVSGKATGGEMQYGTDGETFSASIPKATEAGAYTVWYKVKGDANHNDSAVQKVEVTISEPEPEPKPGALKLSGSGHVQGTGDASAKESGKGIVIGTTGQSRRLEALTVSLPEGTDGAIEYRGHVQGTGWTDWTPGGSECGTRGQAKRMEAVQMALTGAVADEYSVWYRVHSQTYGWLGWATDGEAAGTAGQSKRAEAVEVQVLPIGEEPAGYVEGQASYVGAATADVHLQGTGWTGARSALSFGTTGQSRRLEALSLSVANQPEAGGVTYEAHLQGKGWVDPESDGAVAGTTGQSRRLEAVKISLTGDMGKDYSVWYRVHSQTYGWLGWTHDGKVAGTTGMSKRAEAIEVQVLPKGQLPDGYDAGVAASKVV